MNQDELNAYRAFVGRRMEEKDGIAPEVVRRFAAALGEAVPPNGQLPPMWHYGLFLTEVPTALLGPDGHPARGDFLPPVKLPRRMFAGATFRFHAPLVARHEASKVSEVASVDYREGKSGALVLVRVKIAVHQRGALCIEEEQTIVYRDDGPRTAAVVPSDLSAEAPTATVEAWTPGSVELFRFSAVTFNAHRIHYDRPYAMDVEGYPGLVVHGPLTAVRLCTLAGKVLGRLKEFRFRGEAPLFAGQPIRLVANVEGSECRLAAKRCDGAVAMSAVAVK